MRRRFRAGIVLWASRELLRRPADAVLTCLCLAVTAAVLSTALLLTQAVSDTASRILSAAPSLVVRRTGSSGWSPVPVAEAVSRLRSVTGVVSVRPRLWGPVPSGDGPVTVVGVLPPGAGSDAVEPPSPGTARVGPGVAARGGRLFLGAERLPFTIAARLAPDTAMVSHDLVLLDWRDAGQVLGIAPGFSSDLAVEVFHPQEAEMLVPEIAAALPWPVTVTTRAEAEAAYAGPVFRRGSLALIALAPGLLAMVLLVALTIRERVSRKEETGLLRAIGWTTADLLRLHGVRAALIAVPGVMAGMVAGYGLVFGQGISWPSRLLLGWPRPAPELLLDPSGSLQVLASIGALILLPYLAAALVPVLWAGLADPRDLLEKGR